MYHDPRLGLHELCGDPADWAARTRALRGAGLEPEPAVLDGQSRAELRPLLDHTRMTFRSNASPSAERSARTARDRRYGRQAMPSMATCTTTDSRRGWTRAGPSAFGRTRRAPVICAKAEFCRRGRLAATSWGDAWRMTAPSADRHRSIGRGHQTGLAHVGEPLNPFSVGDSRRIRAIRRRPRPRCGTVR